MTPLQTMQRKGVAIVLTWIEILNPTTDLEINCVRPMMGFVSIKDMSNYSHEHDPQSGPRILGCVPR